MKQSRFTDEQIIGFLKQADAGMSVKELYHSSSTLAAAFSILYSLKTLEESTC